MKVIEKPWQYGTYLAYEEVEPEFEAKEHGVRVLPAPFFYEKKLYFTLKARYAPGDKPTFPNGGFEVIGENGHVRSYDLDQVIIHPDILKQQKMLAKMRVRVEKAQKKRERELKQQEKANNPKRGRRGRPPLSAEAKALKEQLQEQMGIRSGGKRGRPKSTEPKAPKPPRVVGGKRGRPALSEEEKREREAAKALVRMRSGGRRGRPKRR